MGTEERDPAAALSPVEKLLAQASRSGFFALVTALERAIPRAERVGGEGPPRAEALRFRHDPSMGFSASDVRSASLRKGDVADGRSPVQAELVTTFLGLTGSVSPLPLHLPAQIAHEISDRNPARDFLDVFHHRLISLLYRLWSHYQIAREHESDARDAWSTRLPALAGHDVRGAGDDALSAADLLAIMPLLVWRSGTARKLELALETLLGDAVPPGSVRITQMCGEWVQLDSAQGMRLGRATARLGLTSVLGNRAFDRSGRYRITVGPLRGVRADDFMPGGPQQRRVAAIARQLIREPLDFDLEVLLGAEEHSGFALRARTQGASALGKGTWLRGGSNLQRFVVRDAGKVSSATHPSSHPSSQR